MPEPTSYDEQARTAVEQCIARRWPDFILSVAEDCAVPYLDALKYANEMAARAKSVDGGGSPLNRGPKENIRRAPCGTPGGHARHRRDHEEPCQTCKTAEAEYRLIRRQRRLKLA